MVNWTSLIAQDKNAVVNFAKGGSGGAFENAFRGQINPARRIIAKYGIAGARELARKATKRRGLVK